MAKYSVRCWWWSIGITAFFGIALLVLGIVFPFILDQVIKKNAAEQTQMTPGNIALWGQVPGKSGVVIIRNFTFFDFLNPMDVMFRNSTPQFVEVGAYQYQELQNFTELEYNDDKSIVNYKYWIHTNKLGEQNVSRKIRFANFVALGAWYQMNNAEPALLTLQTFGQLVFGLQALILPQAVSTALLALGVRDYASARASVLKGLPELQAQFIYNDTNYGMGNVTSLIAWYNAATDGDTSGSSELLRDYFNLNFTSIESINSYFRTTSQGLLNGFFCSDAPGKICTAEYLAAKQWSQQGITLNPPPLPGVIPVKSVVIGNNTASGYLELSYFYQDYFCVNIDTSDEYKNVTFDITWAMKVLGHANYSLENRQYLTDPYVLLNIGNIRYLYSLGTEYDTTKNKTLLNLISDRFQLSTYQQGRVLWEYIRYINVEFGQQQSKNGSSGILALGGLASQTLYGEFNNLMNQFYSRIVSDLLIQKFIVCSDVLTQIPDITQQTISLFCGRPEYAVWTVKSISSVVLLCDEPGGDYWTQVYRQSQFTVFQLNNLCDGDSPGFGQFYASVHTDLKQHFGCTSGIDRCSQYEIAVKQWTNGSISLNPPSGLWKPTTTVFDIYPDLFSAPMEYYWFYNEYKDVLPAMKVISQIQAQYLLSYDCLFQPTMLINSLLYETNNDIVSFRASFVFDEFIQLNHYVRYLMVQFTLGGLSREQTVEEILFGYNDPFLMQMALMDPAQGGDPSIPYLVGLNLNVTLDQAEPQSMYTGMKDQDMVRKYHSVNGYEYLTTPQPYFDGTQVMKRFINPWRIESPLSRGTDAFCFNPDVQKTDRLSVVVTDIVRSADLIFSSTKEIFGIETYHMILDDSFLSINDSFYNEKYYGLINFTSVQRAPVFNSLPHFLDSDPKISNSVEIYKDYDLKDRQLANEYDKSYIYVEPYTGVAISALVNIQINVLYQSDLLFPGQNFAMMPIMWFYRGANFTQTQVDDNYGPLITGLKVKVWSRWVGIILGGILLVLAVGLTIKRRSLDKQDSEQHQVVDVHEQLI